MKFISVLAILAFPAVSKAYLDPGTGSVIIQAIIAGAVGVGVALKIYWYKITGFFSGRGKGTQDRSDDSGNDKKQGGL